MDEDSPVTPGEARCRCIAKTRGGHHCSAPPLADKSFCFFHDPSGDIAAARDVARGKGLKRQRVLAPMHELPPLAFETPEQLRDFKVELLRRVLARQMEPAVAKVAGELAENIYGEASAKDAAAGWNALTKSIEDALPTWEKPPDSDHE